VGAFITFLLTAQATGAAGVEVIPPFVWLLIGGVGAVINFATGKMNPGTDQRDTALRTLAEMSLAERERIFATLRSEASGEAAPKS
jgi:hypothetical protein